MKAYSVDLRTKIVESVRRRGVSISETARRFGVNRSKAVVAIQDCCHVAANRQNSVRGKPKQTKH